VDVCPELDGVRRIRSHGLRHQNINFFDSSGAYSFTDQMKQSVDKVLVGLNWRFNWGPLR